MLLLLLKEGLNGFVALCILSRPVDLLLLPLELVYSVRICVVGPQTAGHWALRRILIPRPGD